MDNTRYDKYAFTVIGISAVCFSSCMPQKKDVGEYVFIDDRSVCHVDSDCPKLTNGKDRRGHSIYAMTPLDTIDFIMDNTRGVCSQCVSVDAYRHMKTISDRNWNVKADRNEIEADRKWLYEKLNWRYDIGDYDYFVSHWLEDSTKRKRIYNIAHKEGLDVGSYREFSELVGFANN